MTVSMRVMSAGTGYRYLLNSVAVGDGRREPGRPLVDYYTEPGCPPGRWLGTGLTHLAGDLRPGDVVTEEQLARLVGDGLDPTNGEALGKAYPHYPNVTERVDRRVAALPDMLADERAAAIVRIEAEEQSKPVRRAVAGYDLTFSVPKSVSVLWALAPAHIRADIVAAHHAAIDDTLGVFEAEVAATRMGATGPDGAVAQVEVDGVIAAAFDHHDSRAGDPQLHTHVVISAKVRTRLDGKWRSLDGRPVHAAVVALSEHYRATLADQLTARLGVVWQPRDRGVDRNVAWDIAGVPEALLAAFSSRAGAIKTSVEELIEQYVKAHGHRPSRRTLIRLRQQATLATRPDKQLDSLADLTGRWHTTADLLGHAPDGWIPAVLAGRAQQRLTADGVSEATVEGVAATVVGVVGERRSTWRRWNLHAEASRQLMGVRFATPHDRREVLDRVVQAAEAASVRLTPPDLASVPVELQRADGTSVLRPRHSTVYTSAELLAAEDDLLRLADTTTAPRLVAATLAAAADVDRLGEDQAAALLAIAASGRAVDLLIGPAGTGKTTTLRTLTTAWGSLYGDEAVVALAPSAAAAEVLGDGLGVPAETVAKWLHDHPTGGLSAGQLVIVDEASLAGTRTLHRIARRAAEAGVKVLLVGDPHQLGAVDADGALTLLTRARPNYPQLTDVRRFDQPWEAAATLQLRDGNPAALDTYSVNGRLRDGTTEQMVDAAYTAWQADQAAGRTSLLIAPTRDLTTALNIRARADRIATGDVDPAVAVRLHDDTAASIGDVIVTRRNDRRTASSTGRWVRNGDRWTITTINPDGSITAQPAGRTGGAMRLPADYVTRHVELGYATTAHRAQGATVDTAHLIITPTMTRELLYVGMTRGRHGTTAYTCTDTPAEDAEAHHDQPTVTSGRQVLERILTRTDHDTSAHASLRAEQDRAGSLVQLVAEYDTIAAAAQRPHWTELICTSGLDEHQADEVLASDAFGPLGAALRLADALRLDPDELLPRLIAAAPLDDARDVAGVLHHRLDTVIRRRLTRPVTSDGLIVGLVPRATGPMPAGMRQALVDREQLIVQQVRDRLDRILADPARRAAPLAPVDPVRRAEWRRAVAALLTHRALNDGARTDDRDGHRTRLAELARRTLGAGHRPPVTATDRPHPSPATSAPRRTTGPHR